MQHDRVLKKLNFDHLTPHPKSTQAFDQYNTIQYNTKFIYIVGETNSIT